LERTALQMLFSYLSDSPIAPLQKALVEIEDPFSTDVDFSFLEFSTTSFFCELSNVPTELESEVNDVHCFMRILSDFISIIDFKGVLFDS
jgi:Zn-dependent M16 (insulinase) family peptidase